MEETTITLYTSHKPDTTITYTTSLTIGKDGIGFLEDEYWNQSVTLSKEELEKLYQGLHQYFNSTGK
ncbi:hypothetical protein Q5H92_14755 [Hymenobacter sp. M29]|uniref:Phage protein n=1 Tax=Hymenobacter mellowenesis TaxID=3063995 RepID=A0ABT9AF65_9BACT|nr:hypothetical protein [Hymenobacter sp. M29]MDO7847626.1 hypothetical protein [Hymenobacter sp. M29]